MKKKSDVFPLQSSSLASQLEKILRQDAQIFPKDRVWIACSGGPDSTALFHLMCELQTRWKWSLGIFHFHHGLRGKDADRDQRFVQKLAKTLRVPFFSGHARVRQTAKQEKTSLEETARKLRYEFLIRAAQKKKVRTVLLAHTLDDQAETVLMRMIQGTGLKGLLGIRKKLVLQGIVFYRPLLQVSKQQILEYLRGRRIPFKQDSTNRSHKMLRNKIRGRLLPELRKSFNPRIHETLARIPSVLQADWDALEAMGETAWRNLLKNSALRGKPKAFTLDRKTFLSYPSSLRFRLLQRAVQKLNPRSGIDFDAWQRLEPGIVHGAHRSNLLKNVDFIVTPEKLSLIQR